MGGNTNPERRWLTAAVLLHLVVSIVHGTAHAGAHVPLSPAANLFVFTVILAGPLVGLALTWPAERFRPVAQPLGQGVDGARLRFRQEIGCL